MKYSKSGSGKANVTKTSNTCPVVVKTPTRYTGGMNKAPVVVKKPTGTVGGTNPPAKVNPKGK